MKFVRIVEAIKGLFNGPLTMTWLDLFVKFGTHLLLLPIATIYLSAAELSYFLFASTLFSLAYLAEAGLNRVVLRAVSYFKEGSLDLPDSLSDIANIRSADEPNYKLIGELYFTTQVLYLTIGLVSLVIFYSVGLALSTNILSRQPDLNDAYLSFFLLSLYSAVLIIQSRLIGLIQGIGYLVGQKQIEIMAGLLRAFLTLLAIIMGFGMLGISIGMLCSVLISCLLYRRLFYNRIPIEKLKSHYAFRIEMVRKLWPSAWRQAVLAWGSFLVYEGSVLLVVQLNDVVLIASYLLTIRIVHLLIRVSNAPAVSYYPEISTAIAHRDVISLKATLYRCLKISLSIYLIGAVTIFFAGNHILEHLGADSLLVSGGILLLILFMYLLELHHVVHATIYTATNHIPFVAPALFSGLAIILFGYLVIGPYGLLGIVVVQFLVQLSFNNWYPVWLNSRLIQSLRAQS